MNLADDNAFCAVDDERAAVGHERNVAHVNILLQNGACLLEVQVDACLQRDGIGLSLALALQFAFDVAFIQLIELILQRHVFVLALDGERGREHFLQALLEQRLFLVQPFFLDETFIRRKLNVNKARNFHEILNVLADVLTNNLFTFCEHHIPLGVERSCGFPLQGNFLSTGMHRTVADGSGPGGSLRH